MLASWVWQRLPYIGWILFASSISFLPTVLQCLHLFSRLIHFIEINSQQFASHHINNWHTLNQWKCFFSVLWHTSTYGTMWYISIHYKLPQHELIVSLLFGQMKNKLNPISRDHIIPIIEQVIYKVSWKLVNWNHLKIICSSTTNYMQRKNDNNG